MKKDVLICACAVSLFLPASVFCNGQEEPASAAPKELTIWEALWYNTAVSVTSLAETPLYKELEKRTGVKVTWIHPPQGQSSEHFNLMIASNELPDMIYTRWQYYPGGPSAAINDGIIIRLNDLIEKHAPNLKKQFKMHPDWERDAKLDDGSHPVFPNIQSHDDLLVFFGPQMRKDWLEKVGLQRPETLDEWEQVLTAFREEGLCEHPLTFTNFRGGRSINADGSAFIQPFHTTWRYYVDDNGQVHYGPYDDQFKDFLIFFKGWFDKGLIDPEFFSNDRKTFDAKILNGVAGAWINYVGSGIGTYLDAYKGPDDFDIVAVKYPVLNKGETPFYGQRSQPLGTEYCGTAITTQAKNPELCAQWSDYAYGDEGRVLFNFGIEGESFQWVTDYPGFEGQKFAKYTDLMMNNPEGKTLAQMGGLYTRAFYDGPTIIDRQYILQYSHRPQQREALKLWAQTEAVKHQLPNISLTAEESAEASAISSETYTYFEEMVVKFITGKEPLENFEAYRQQMKKMGIERAIEIQQAAFDRYNER